MFPQFGATAEGLSKASSLVFRVGTDAHLYDDPDDVSIAPLLDSRFDSEKSEALKRLLALIAQGVDVSNFFPQVVKNVASQSLEVKKLVYLYLLHYAEKRPNEALLSINYFQKDLSDSNPLVRAWALRAMSGIRLHAIAPLVLVAVGKCAKDPSAYVRKCAANALPKLHDLHQEENVLALEELISVLLSDHSPGVIGAAAAAFNAVCPSSLSLIGRHFKRLCETLPDIEEWGQIVLIEILLRYVVARHGLVKESIMFSSLPTEGCSQYEKNFADVHLMSENDCGIMGDEEYNSKLSTQMFRCYIEGTEEHFSWSDYTNIDNGGLSGIVFTSCQNSDVKILLQGTSPLLWSQNSAVVLAAAGVHWIMASRGDLKRIVKPILFLLRSSYASKYVVLCNIQVFAKAMPSLFAPYYEDFFVCSSDSYLLRTIKLEILSTIAMDSSIPFIFQEFQDYIKDPDRRFVADTVAAISLCAQKLPAVANTCLDGLLALTRQGSSIGWGSAEAEAGVLVQAIMSIKSIIKLNPTNYEKVIIQLARNLDAIKEPSARALIVWIVGEYSSVGQIIPKIVPIVLEYLARCFTSEEVETKHQILNTTAKAVLYAQGEEVLMFERVLSYVLELAKCDLNYDIRDRARILEKLLPFSCKREGNSHLTMNDELTHKIVECIIGGKIQSATYSSNSFRLYLPGSLSQIVLHAAPGYGPLPKPCSLLDGNLGICSDMVQEKKEAEDASDYTDSVESNDHDSLSGSSIEDSDLNYDSHHSVVSSVDSKGFDYVNDTSDNGPVKLLQARHGTQETSLNSPLIHLSDSGGGYNKSAEENISMCLSTDMAQLMSKTALESWLDEQPSLSEPSSSKQRSGHQASARISVKEIGVSVRPKVHTLLDPANGFGLRLDYLFSSEISTISPLLVCVEVLFKNCSAEPLTKITMKDAESNESLESISQDFQTQERILTPIDVPTIIPMEEIAYLDPGQTVKRILQVRFHHHLLPVKLVVFCNEKTHLIKLQPDIGYFIRPLSMDTESFTMKESRLPGMFEYTKRCTFTDHIAPEHEDCNSSEDDKILKVCQRLASKMLGNANVFLVSVDMPVSVAIDDVSGLCLRFSSEILSNSKPCLITIVSEGKCTEPLNVSIKVNCEETIFGLNLLNRVASFLT